MLKGVVNVDRDMQSMSSFFRMLEEAARCRRIRLEVIAPEGVVVDDRYLPLLLELVTMLPEESTIRLSLWGGRLDRLRVVSPGGDVEAVYIPESRELILDLFYTPYRIKYRSRRITQLLLPNPALIDAVTGKIDSSVFKSLLVGMPYSYVVEKLPDTLRKFIDELAAITHLHILPERPEIIVTPSAHGPETTLIVPGGFTGENYVAVKLDFGNLGIIVLDREQPRTYIVRPREQVLTAAYIYLKPLDEMLRTLEIEVDPHVGLGVHLGKGAEKSLKLKLTREAARTVIGDLKIIREALRRYISELYSPQRGRESS